MSKSHQKFCKHVSFHQPLMLFYTTILHRSLVSFSLQERRQDIQKVDPAPCYVSSKCMKRFCMILWLAIRGSTRNSIIWSNGVMQRCHVNETYFRNRFNWRLRKIIKLTQKEFCGNASVVITRVQNVIFAKCYGIDLQPQCVGYVANQD